MKRNNDLIREWIAALRSGKYNQCKGQLHNIKDTAVKDAFCCLGVLCEVGIKTHVLTVDPTDLEYYKFETQTEYGPSLFETVLSPHFLAYVGMKQEEQNILIYMNDSKHESFLSIANYIEQNILDKEVEDGSNQSNTGTSI